jgi:hypothetical protein
LNGIYPRMKYASVSPIFGKCYKFHFTSLLNGIYPRMLGFDGGSTSP